MLSIAKLSKGRMTKWNLQIPRMAEVFGRIDGVSLFLRSDLKLVFI